MRTSDVNRCARTTIILCALLLTACEVELYANISEQQANGMLKALLNNGIDASKEFSGKGLYAVKVEKSDLVDAVNILDAAGLPSEQYTDLKEMFEKDGLISSPMEERIRYMYSLSQSIAETLTNIDGVLVARVHVAVPESDKFSGKKNPTSASVFIKYQEGFVLAGAKSEIKRIVENSIEGLSYQNIAVYLSFSKSNQADRSDAELRESKSFLAAQGMADRIKIFAFIMFVFVLALVAVIIRLSIKLGYTVDMKVHMHNVRTYYFKIVNRVMVAVARSPREN